MLKKLKALIFENFFIKLFSVIFAVLLWLHVVARGKSEVDFVVPLELRDVPKELVVVGDVPSYLNVRLSGQEELIRTMSTRDITAFIGLANAKAGEAAYHLSGANIQAPRNITTLRVAPEEIKLRLEPLEKRTLPVKPDILGNPAAGYRFVKVEVVPESVNVQGPEGYLRRLKSVVTKPVDLEGATGSFERQVSIEPPGEKGVRLTEDSVRVVVTLAKTRK